MLSCFQKTNRSLVIMSETQGELQANRNWCEASGLPLKILPNQPLWSTALTYAAALPYRPEFWKKLS